MTIDKAASVAGSSFRQVFGLKVVAQQAAKMPKKPNVHCKNSKELRWIVMRGFRDLTKPDTGDESLLLNPKFAICVIVLWNSFEESIESAVRLVAYAPIFERHQKKALRTKDLFLQTRRVYRARNLLLFQVKPSNSYPEIP